MRPINLIPPEDRRGHDGSSRTGPLAYIVVGALGVVLIGIVMLVLTSSQITDREGEVETLEAQKSAVAAKAATLAPYVSFEQVAQQRTQTITELADSRFDWPRVIRQLSLILPRDVYLESLTGSAGGGGGEAESVAAPSLIMTGCAPAQDSVAAFVSSLKQIDGVTRVGLRNSSLAGEEGSGEGCKQFGFNLTVAFDAAPISPDAGGFTVEPAPAEGEVPAEGESSEGEAPTEGEAPATESEPSTAGTASSSTSASPTG